MIRVDLFINGTEVDLYDEVSIQVKDSIKQAKDIANVFTAFSQQFRIPASKTNNKLFKHYYSVYIEDGFDARRKHPALIKLNGADFKKGYIKLLGVDVKDMKAESYRVQFFGEVTSLKDQLGEDKLSSLDWLSRFNHEFDSSTVIDGFELGLQYSGGSMIRGNDGEIIYPFISHTRGFKYTTADGLFDITESGTPDSNDRLDYTDLKPAIQVRQILLAIEDKYNLKFGGEFIDLETETNILSDMYMWCHKNKGGIVTDDPTTNQPEWIGDIEDLTKDSFTPSAADDPGLDIQIYDQDDGLGNNDDWDKYVNIQCNEQAVDPNNTAHILTYDIGGGQRTYYTGTLTITPSGSFTADYNVFFYSDILNRVWVEEYDQSGTQAFSFDINESNIELHDLQFRVTSSGLDEFDIDLDITGKRDSRCTAELTRVWSYTKTITSAELITIANIPFNMPNMKVIDFLRTIMRMFNLVAYDRLLNIVSDTYEIVLEPLHVFYDSGAAVDITKYVDVTSITFDRVNPYNLIKFKYAEPKTYLAIQANEITQREFGNLEVNTTNFGPGDGDFLFDGGEYSVDLKLEKMQFERMLNQTTGGTIQLQWGWFVNDFSENTAEPELGNPLMFFRVNRSNSSASITWKDTSTSNTTFNAPSNVNDDSSQTLNFGEEFDEFTLLSNENSLFKNYYERYVAGIFDRDARRMNITAYLPADIIYNYSLNDKLIINSVAWQIESITPNVMTGKTRLELLKITGREEEWDIIIDKFGNYEFEDFANYSFNETDPIITNYDFNT